jgi:excisionase family DNA binding protein
MSDPNSTQANPAGNVVRLEMFLTAEQIALLFKSIVTGQHTVMTLREAAAHLRMNAHALEAMATEGEIPAFQLDGRWRFSRAAVDEWLSLRPLERKDQEAA